ncbi:iron/manganese-dependent transcriptional regulator [Desulfuromonas sp. DDH964]|uniref:metal-dependent transcriptional regulator n=1 Tax=Desulfuromonas sp. DDH964 TaxID=1823759 RepID=UPI00078DC359|nr:metal-dependent transcriptional regulator [Desulfuromonas sp. DDH964]AMV70592.1 iron/manganese-dependent transcriptional regulator [Desulfuromonas sp. DDH964]
MQINEQIEEALEVLWVCLMDASPQLNTESQLKEKLQIPLNRLVQEGLVESKNESIHFTPAGKQEAERAIRRHRLSERLFHDIIETDQADMEEAACQVEHIVKKGIEEKICRLLGHPETCPHGKPIPPGDCCRKARETKEKFVAPLASLKPGETGTIAYIKAGDSKKLQKLMAMGVLPGNAIELNANFPSFVFSVDYSQYAVDADMASAIIVKRGESGS